MVASRFDCSAIRASFVETVGELNVPPVVPWRRRHARHCLPAALRLLSWVPWALVPHASGQGAWLPPVSRYCALLRLPSSFPVGSLVVPLTTTIHFSEFNDAACALAFPLLRTPPLGDHPSVWLSTCWLGLGRVGLFTHWVTMTIFKGVTLSHHSGFTLGTSTVFVMLLY